MVIRKRSIENSDKPKFGRDNKPRGKSGDKKFSSAGGDYKRKPSTGSTSKREDDKRPYSKSKFGSDSKDGRKSDFKPRGERNESARFSAGKKTFGKPSDRPFSKDRKFGSKEGSRFKSMDDFGGDKPRFSERRTNTRAPRGEEKPRFQKRDGFSSDRPKFSDRKSDARAPRGEEKPRFQKRDGFNSDRPKYSDRNSDSRAPRSDDKPRFQKREGFSSDRPRFSENKSEGRGFKKDEKPSFGAKRTYKSKEGLDGDRPKSFGKKDEESSYKTERRPVTRGSYKDKKGGRKGKSTESEYAAQTEDIRLNRYISNAGICSRREADKLIGAGLVSVNGVTITEMGYQVKPGDQVKYNNSRLSADKKVYILMNKPKDVITTLDDPDGRKIVTDLLKNEDLPRVYPVGRLDRNTTGVLLLTNDGELAARLMHPKYEVQKIYLATLFKNMKGEDLWTLTNGVELEDGFIKPDSIAMPDAKIKNEIGVEIHSGRNRIVHRMFEHVGYPLEKLDRVLYAGLSRKGLKRGGFRHLDPRELTALKKLVKLR